MNATLANGFGLEDCDGCLLLSSPPPPELNANNEGLAVVVSAGLTRVVNANGFDAGAGAFEDDDGVIFLVPALILFLDALIILRPSSTSWLARCVPLDSGSASDSDPDSSTT